jgi:hypothetical protein
LYQRGNPYLDTHTKLITSSHLWHFALGPPNFGEQGLTWIYGYVDTHFIGFDVIIQDKTTRIHHQTAAGCVSTKSSLEQ